MPFEINQTVKVNFFNRLVKKNKIIEYIPQQIRTNVELENLVNKKLPELSGYGLTQVHCVVNRIINDHKVFGKCYVVESTIKMPILQSIISVSDELNENEFIISEELLSQFN